MKVERLSANGCKLTEVFDSDTFSELSTLIDSFTPSITRYQWGIAREVFFVEGSLKDRIIHPRLVTARSVPTTVELWRDYPGYTNAKHLDDPMVHNILIVYFGDSDEGMGTTYWEDGKEYSVEYKKNTGLLLTNSNTVYHGMTGAVTGVDYRRSLYINWRDIDGQTS